MSDEAAGGGGAGVSEQPDAIELIEVARESLLEHVLPALEGEARYHALMIANAMAIALRELGAGGTDLEREVDDLRGLYEHREGDAADAAEEDPVQTLTQLEARLARDLRDGVLDGGPQFAVRRWLRARIESRLAVSNPRALARRRDDTGGEAS